MYLRELKNEDAPYMLEWMHDESVTHDMPSNFAAKELGDCEAFIASSKDTTLNLHMAIASDTDEYMGTVSLKHINIKMSNAEFAISVRKTAMGRGYSWLGMMEILRIAFEERGLNCVYWCVSSKNERAIRFYRKHSFHETFDVLPEIAERYVDVPNLIWFSVLRGDDYKNASVKRGSVSGCKIISIKTIATVNAGELSFFEATHDIPFSINRIYYISKVAEGVRRGFHAHKELKQLLFCPYGAIQLLLDDGAQREEITLNDPSVGVIIDHPVWREMLWLEKDSVLCVAASDYYNPHDYIRNYNEFLSYRINGGKK